MKIRVVSDGLSIGQTRVYDADTGEELKTVQQVIFNADVNDGITALITFIPADGFELETKVNIQE